MKTAEYAIETKNITFFNSVRYCFNNQIEIYYDAVDFHITRAYIDDVDRFVTNMKPT